MNVDHILSAMHDRGVRYLLIGGMNFLLRHEPVLTYDVDLWIEDTEENRRRCEKALASLDAAWGATEADWMPVAGLPAGWLDRQPVFALTTAHGAVDIFRSVVGLSDWSASFAAAAGSNPRVDMNELTRTKRREEAKREAAWDPKVRWRVLQETITWAEMQATVRRNTPARCLQEQARQLRQF